MSKIVKVAAAQMDCVLGDIDKNTEKVIDWVGKAAQNGADTIVFPELCLTGYNQAMIGARWFDLAETKDGEHSMAIRKAAKENGINVVYSMPQKVSGTPGIIYISSLVAGKDGELLANYLKIHLWYLEKMYFTPSATCEFAEFYPEWGHATTFICYDSCFPEYSRSLALHGVQAIFAPTAWAKSDGRYWDIFVRARACENHIFFVGANRCGVEGDLALYGGSQIIDPYGDCIAQVKDGEDIIYADLDLDLIPKAHSTQAHLKDRRPEAYGEVVKHINW